MSELVTSTYVAGKYGVHSNVVRRWVKAGKLRGARRTLGGQLRFVKAEIDAQWAENDATSRGSIDETTASTTPIGTIRSASRHDERVWKPATPLKLSGHSGASLSKAPEAPSMSEMLE